MEVNAIAVLAVEGIPPESTAFEGFEVEHEFPAIGRKVMLLNARRLDAAGQKLILPAIEDRTELARHARELASANEAKDNFLAALSHELRTPLTAMLGWARMLRSGRLDETRAAEALEVIERNTKLQAKPIEDLLGVSRITAGKLHVEVRLIDLAPVIGSAVEAQRPTAEAKKLQLDVSIDARPGCVLGDAHRLPMEPVDLVDAVTRLADARVRTSAA